MSRADRKYKREEKAKANLSQRCFGFNGQVEDRKRVTVSSHSVDVNRIVFCPFCLKENKLQRFLVSGKEGISQSKAECPECHKGMMMRNLLRKWTPEAYADWVYGYRKSGFWQKINFAEWKEQLNRKGWSQRFWERYNALKGESSETGGDESYAEYMNRQGEEAARMWNEADGYA